MRLLISRKNELEYILKNMFSFLFFKEFFLSCDCGIFSVSYLTTRIPSYIIWQTFVDILTNWLCVDCWVRILGTIIDHTYTFASQPTHFQFHIGKKKRSAKTGKPYIWVNAKLDQSNTISLYSKWRVIRFYSNLNDSMRFLITYKVILDNALIQMTPQERFW